MAPGPAAVRVPCSTSNLGSGFDTLGLALDRYLEARFHPSPGPGLEVERAGTLAELAVPDGDDLAVRAFQATAEAAGWRPRGTLVLTSEIPLARGLGSSAAARVAGHALARVASGGALDAEAAFQAAAAGEGHGDNAAPAALGGFRGVVVDAGRFRAFPLELSAEVGIAYAAPGRGISTRAARAALPASVSHATAVRGLGRLAALLRGLAGADPELIGIGVGDELHVPWRLPLIAGADGAMEAGLGAGAWGVTISGAGSGLVAFAAPGDAEAVAAAMGEALTADGAPGGVAMALRPDREGVRLLSP